FPVQGPKILVCRKIPTKSAPGTQVEQASVDMHEHIRRPVPVVIVFTDDKGRIGTIRLLENRRLGVGGDTETAEPNILVREGKNLAAQDFIETNIQLTVRGEPDVIQIAIAIDVIELVADRIPGVGTFEAATQSWLIPIDRLAWGTQV